MGGSVCLIGTSGSIPSRQPALFQRTLGRERLAVPSTTTTSRRVEWIGNRFTTAQSEALARIPGGVRGGAELRSERRAGLGGVDSGSVWLTAVLDGNLRI